MIRSSIRQMQEYRSSSETHQAAFFEKIGVDEYICRVGSERCGAEDFYGLTVEDMALFGVDRVKAPADYEKMDLAPFRRTGKSVEFVSVPKDYRDEEPSGD